MVYCMPSLLSLLLTMPITLLPDAAFRSSVVADLAIQLRPAIVSARPAANASRRASLPRAPTNWTPPPGADKVTAGIPASGPGWCSAGALPCG